MVVQCAGLGPELVRGGVGRGMDGVKKGPVWVCVGLKWVVGGGRDDGGKKKKPWK